jgi:two-component system response regulator YesN
MYTIVLADDEYMIKRSLCKLIEQSGYPYQVVGEAEDGQEAMVLVDQWSPDLLITDIRMPVMDGLECMEAVKASKKSTQIVILSGYDDFGYAQKALRMGAFDYLLKPIKPAMFQSMLERLTEKLEESQRAASKRSEWLLYSKSHLSALTNQLWVLNSEAVKETLETIHSDFISDNPTAGELMERYADLITLLTGELESLQLEPMKKGILVSEETPVKWPNGSQEQLQAVCSLLDEWIEELRSTRKWGTHHHLHRAVEYMKNHYADADIDLQRVAEVSEVSPSYFSRVFKQEMGVSFVLYLTQLRLEKAKELLADARFKTYEIALQIGYEDYPHFAKVFKKHTGVSPTDYRKRLGVK